MVFKIILCVKEGGVKRWKDVFIFFTWKCDDYGYEKQLFPHNNIL
jgi:hypothetical protein